MEDKELIKIKQIGIFVLGVSIGNLIISILYLALHGAELVGFGTKMAIIGGVSLLWAYVAFVEYQDRVIKSLKDKYGI